MRAIIVTTKATLFDVEQQSVYARVRRKSKELFERRRRRRRRRRGVGWAPGRTHDGWRTKLLEA